MAYGDCLTGEYIFIAVFYIGSSFLVDGGFAYAKVYGSQKLELEAVQSLSHSKMVPAWYCTEMFLNNSRVRCLIYDLVF